MVEGHGPPIAIITAGANTHDIKLSEDTLENVAILRPEATPEKPQNLCLDAGYTGAKDVVEEHGYIAHIRPRGEEKREMERNPKFKARRWIVEVTHSWTNRFRKLLVRFEKKNANYQALLAFAFAIIVWRKIISVHPS